MGCDPGTVGTSYVAIRADDGGYERIYECPNRLLRGTDTWRVIELYDWMNRTGALPNGGGVLDQRPKLMKAFRFLANETARIEADRQRVAERYGEKHRGPPSGQT